MGTHPHLGDTGSLFYTAKKMLNVKFYYIRSGKCCIILLSHAICFFYNTIDKLMYLGAAKMLSTVSYICGCCNHSVMSVFMDC